ncbi:MAG: TIGR03960 family B12-binding radical SAM protein [Desulfosarcinaceae bacterium]
MNETVNVLNMAKVCIQDILGNVDKPSRYLGSETNRIHKPPDSVKLRIALAFPDLYEIGISHFGIQILYDILNQHKDIAAEQVFAPGRDLEDYLRQMGMPLPSLESGTALGEFHIIGFSLLYELNYTNVLNMLDLSGIPVRWKDRGPQHPLVIAGGPCVCNPEPMADFFDVMVFGDGEEVIVLMAETWMEWHRSGEKDKNRLLRQWSKLPGVYVPCFFEAEYDEDGFQRLIPKFDDYKKVSRAILSDLDGAGFPERPIVPFGRPVHDRLRLEVSRGCSRGCRFCQAGMIYRPVRERSPEKLARLFDLALNATGFEDVSLLSLSTGDYTCLAPLIEDLMERSRKAMVALSLPSVRAGSLTPRLMKLIRSVRKTGFTIAPEAGSQRLRDVINKNISFEDVATTIENAFDLGWQVIKLYFMVGLPTENEQDLDALVAMVKELKKIKKPKSRKGQLNVSVTTFIPKPHTPFQWARQLTMDESRAAIDKIRDGLRTGGIQVKWQDKGMSLLEGVMARGDRRLCRVLETAWKSGCVFDGWGDLFDMDRWQQAFEHCGVDMDFYTTRERRLDELLPWDHMDAGVRKAFLKEQWQAATTLEKTEDCRYGACHNCGVCDFKEVRPVVFQTCAAEDIQAESDHKEGEQEEIYSWREVIYSKMGQARFFGHLEQARLFARALKRAHIDLAYSHGFHPMPRISFDSPLPLGMESESERMRLLVLNSICCEEIHQRMNEQLPQGLRVESCAPVEGRKMKVPGKDRYRIRPAEEAFDTEAVGKFTEAVGKFTEAAQWPHLVEKRKNPKEQQVDLKRIVETIAVGTDGTLDLELRRLNSRIVRPSEVLAGIFGMNSQQVRKCRVCKLASR